MASRTSSMASRNSSRDWVIQMTRNCCGSQTPSQPPLNQTSSQQPESQTQTQPPLSQTSSQQAQSQTQSQPTQNDKGEIRVSWIKSNFAQEVRRAWDHVLANTPEGDKAAIRSKYVDAVKAMENKAKAIYKNDNFNPVPGNSADFVRTMIDQGCFTLLVVLRSFSGSDDLGINWTKQQIRTWMLDLFSIRNQLPLVVLQEFMKQAFFDKALESVKKRKRPNDLPRKVFYDHLVEAKPDSPSSQVNLMNRFLSWFGSRGLSHQEPPPTLLHALWLLLTGPGSVDAVNNSYNDDDENDCLWSTVRSATELKEKIIFKNNKETGTRGIYFKENMFDAQLYLPSITIEADTDKLFKHLIDYEEDIFNKNQREVCAYLKLMSELVRTPDDAKILAMQGIIHAQPLQEENLHEMLQNLPLPQGLGNDKNLQVRDKIRSYVKPSKWEKMMNLIVFTLLLTLLTFLVAVPQTVYTVIGYYHSSGSGSNGKN